MIIQDGALATGATIVLNFGNDRAMVTHPGAMDHLSLQEIAVYHLNKGKHLHFSSYFLQPQLKPDIGKLFQLARQLGLTTSFDAQWDPAEKWDLDLKQVLPFVDVFLPNKAEALFLSGEKTLAAALDRLSRLGHTIVVKLGEEGSISQSDQGITKVEPFLNKNVVDAIGAGDSFNAGYIYKFIQGEDVEQCQIFGNLMGAINTTQSGGTTAFTDFASILTIAGERFGYHESS
jgi:sugar/nucleoside kinase (ribokinase family)